MFKAVILTATITLSVACSAALFIGVTVATTPDQMLYPSPSRYEGEYLPSVELAANARLPCFDAMAVAAEEARTENPYLHYVQKAKPGQPICTPPPASR